jgi:hypothetical protein
MALEFTRLTHKIAIQLHQVAETFTICSSRSRRPVRKLLDTPSYIKVTQIKVAMRWMFGLNVDGYCCCFRAVGALKKLFEIDSDLNIILNLIRSQCKLIFAPFPQLISYSPSFFVINNLFRVLNVFAEMENDPKYIGQQSDCSYSLDDRVWIPTGAGIFLFAIMFKLVQMDAGGSFPLGRGIKTVGA